MNSLLIAIMIPPEELTEEIKLRAKDANEFPELHGLLKIAKEEFERVQLNPAELYSLLVNPAMITLSAKQVDEIMNRLGSKKEQTGAWLPVIVVFDGKYFRISGKTEYCG